MLNEQCCATNDLTFSSTLLKQANQSLIASKCSNPKCSLKQLDNLIGIQSGIVDPKTGCTAAFRREANSATLAAYQDFINKCQYKILGERLQGIKCTSNSDCYSGVCNITVGLCSQGNQELVQVRLSLICWARVNLCLISASWQTLKLASPASCSIIGGLKKTSPALDLPKN